MGLPKLSAKGLRVVVLRSKQVLVLDIRTFGRHSLRGKGLRRELR